MEVRMKRITATVVVMVILLTSGVLFGGCSYRVRESGVEDGFCYDIFEDNTAMITGYTGDASELTTPAEIKGYRVRSIEYGALAGNKTIKKITVAGENVQIGEQIHMSSRGYYQYGTFEGCTSLETVILCEGVWEINERTFRDCTALKTVHLPSSVRSFGIVNLFGPEDEAFSGCVALENITIGDGARGFDADTFADTRYYNTDANWENGVLYIGNHLLAAETTLTGDYIIHDNTVSVAPFAFDECETLTGVAFPQSVKSIGRYAFSDCSALRKIVLPDVAIEIGDNVFNDTAYYRDADCWEAEVLYIGNHLIKAKDTICGEYPVRPGTITIADEAFFNCAEVTNVYVPDTIKWIGDDAFFGCDLLKNVPKVRND